MPTKYTLNVVNNSELPDPTFAVFAKLPARSNFAMVNLAWMTRQIDAGNNYTFTWDLTWGLAWAAQGTEPGYQWSGSGTLPADPNSPTQCQATFSYDGDFRLRQSPGKPDGYTLSITDDATVPVPSKQASSLAVMLDGASVCATNAGPNLSQAFTLHPTYYIDAGNYVPGQMVDGASVTAFQELAYTKGNTALTATLGPENTWTLTVPPSSAA
jgi:hypothetical protein